MTYLFNIAYLLALVAAWPWLVYKAISTGKYRRGFCSKLSGQALLRDGEEPCAWFHGVSVGEIHLLRQVVARFRRRHPDWDCVISTTTDTGYTEACKCFPELHVFYWPLDFSWAVHRALRRVNPSLVVLAEGELWPNFLRATQDRGVPVAVINGRLSPRSFRRYRRLAGLARKVLGYVDLFAVQTEEYADCFRALGVLPARIRAIGSVKYDGVDGDRDNPRTGDLARLFTIGAGELVWIAGSTQAPEEAIALDIYRRVRPDHPNLRLFIVPRQKDRFEEVARVLERSGLAFVRRSELRASLPSQDASPVVLVDSIGELGALWGLADVAYVGGSLDGRRGGQNMIEPAAYGAAVIFGPHVWNFRDTAERLVAAGAAIQVADVAALETAVRKLLSDSTQRQRLASAAQRLVLQQQGATERTIDCLDLLLAPGTVKEKAA